MTVIMTKPVLKIDPEFQAKIPPLSEEEFKQLEENILSEGEVFDAIVTWNGIIVDGHNRWKIVQDHPEANIKYRTREMMFTDRWEAIDWMCANQLGRRNLTWEQRRYLQGKLYEARKHTSKGGQKDNQNASKKRMAKDWPIESKNHDGVSGTLAKELGISHNTVKDAGKYAKGIDALKETAPEVAADILAGKKKITNTAIQQIGSATSAERPALITAVIEGKPLPKKEPPPKSEPTPPSSQPDTPTFSFDKPISTRTKAGQQLMSEIRTVIENQGNGEIIRPTLSVVSEMLMYDVQAMIERFHDFMNTNKEIATEEIVKHIKASINQLSMLKEVLQNS